MGLVSPAASLRSTVERGRLRRQRRPRSPRVRLAFGNLHCPGRSQNHSLTRLKAGNESDPGHRPHRHDRFGSPSSIPVRGRRSEPPQPARPKPATARANPVTSPQTNENQVLTALARLPRLRPQPLHPDPLRPSRHAKTLKQSHGGQRKSQAAVQVSDRAMLDVQQRGAFLFTERVDDQRRVEPRQRRRRARAGLTTKPRAWPATAWALQEARGPENKNVVIVSAVTRRGQDAQKKLDEIHPGFHGSRSTVLHRFGADPSYSNWRRRFFVARPAPGMNVVTNNSTNSVDIATHIRSLAEQTRPVVGSRERSSRWQPTPEITLTVSERNSPALFGAGQIDADPIDGFDRPWPSGSPFFFFFFPRSVAESAATLAAASVVSVESANLEPPRVRSRRPVPASLVWRSPAIRKLSPSAPQEKAKGLDLLEPECDALVAYVRSLPASRRRRP